MKIKQKVERILDKYYIDDMDSSMQDPMTPVVVDKIDLLYRKQMEREIRGMEKPMSDHFKETNRIELTRDKMNRGYNQALQNVIDLLRMKTEDLLAKYASVIATNRSKKIDDSFKKVVPGWQQKLLLLTRSRLLGKLFGWELRTFVGSEKWEIWNRGKRYFVSEDL